MRLSSEQLAEFEKLRWTTRVSRGCKSVADWLSRVNVQNHDGVTVTPVLSALLIQTEDFKGTINQSGRAAGKDEKRTLRPGR